MKFTLRNHLHKYRFPLWPIKLSHDFSKKIELHLVGIGTVAGITQA